MIVTAVLAIRNEEAYLANCLRHLVRNGLHFAIIDNGSSDGSAAIYRRRKFAPYLVEVRELPFSGAFSLSDQLACKMALIESLATDWVVHVDADEEMHSRRPGESLADALARCASAGYNVVDFDEFVFLPIDHDYVPDAAECQPMALYYYFRPHAPRLMRAWDKSSGLSMIEHGGHVLVGDEVRLASERFVLRHYPFRSQAHAHMKYTTRTFSKNELTRGWHRARAGKMVNAFDFPPASMLQRLADPRDHELDDSKPWTKHYWDVPSEPQRARPERTPL